MCSHEAGLAGVDEGLGGEPLPHERARGTVVDGVDQAADVVVHFICGCVMNPVSSRIRWVRKPTFELQLVRWPALLQSHDIGHGLTSAVALMRWGTCLPREYLPPIA